MNTLNSVSKKSGAKQNPQNLESAKKLEQEVLRLLCGFPDGPPDRLRSHALCKLSLYQWKDADHRVVFDALRRSPGRDPALLREQLPADATRLGFPDVDWSVFFDNSDSADPGKIQQLTRELLQISGEGSGAS